MKNLMTKIGFETVFGGLFGIVAIIAIIAEMVIGGFDSASVAGGIKESVENASPSQLFQCTPKFRLENDDQGDHAHAQCLRCDPKDRIEIKDRGEKDDDQNDNDSFKQCPCPGFLKPDHQIVKKDRNDNDLDHIDHRDRRNGKILLKIGNDIL